MHQNIEKPIREIPSWLIPVSAVALTLLIAFVSLTGIFVDDFYGRETINWQLQSGGQDIFNLLVIAPLLVICAMNHKRNRGFTTMLFLGILIYNVYSFIIYAFDLHFNRIFLAYCLVVCISLYTLLYILFVYLNQPMNASNRKHYPFKITGAYFLLTSVLFGGLWMSEIIPAVISNTLPMNLAVVNLPTNPVHVLDLSIILPGIFVTGIMLLRKDGVAFLMAPVFLIFIALMDTTIALLSVILKVQGEDGSFYVAGGMVLLALISVSILFAGFKSQFTIK
ncbi:hypothetical protein BH10BAC4_BH10BAC4_25050 [soil metagenome]